MNCDRKFTQLISVANIFITDSLFNERLSVAGYSLQTLLITFRRKNLRIQVLANIPWNFGKYSESTHFRFCIFALHISNKYINGAKRRQNSK